LCDEPMVPAGKMKVDNLDETAPHLADVS